eukprot:428784_1
MSWGDFASNVKDSPIRIKLFDSSVVIQFKPKSYDEVIRKLTDSTMVQNIVNERRKNNHDTEYIVVTMHYQNEYILMENNADFDFFNNSTSITRIIYTKWLNELDINGNKTATNTAVNGNQNESNNVNNEHKNNAIANPLNPLNNSHSLSTNGLISKHLKVIKFVDVPGLSPTNRLNRWLQNNPNMIIHQITPYLTATPPLIMVVYTDNSHVIVTDVNNNQNRSNKRKIVSGNTSDDDESVKEDNEQFQPPSKKQKTKYRKVKLFNHYTSKKHSRTQYILHCLDKN